MSNDLMLLMQGHESRLACERALGEGLKDVAAELRLIDLLDYAAFIRAEQFANIEDLVNSSIELFFKPETLKYGWSADIDVRWNHSPTVRLDMEFHHAGVSVFFGLILENRLAGIDIRKMSFSPDVESGSEELDRLVAAIEQARLLADR